jgi:hypothetical protein
MTRRRKRTPTSERPRLSRMMGRIAEHFQHRLIGEFSRREQELLEAGGDNAIEGEPNEGHTTEHTTTRAAGASQHRSVEP